MAEMANSEIVSRKHFNILYLLIYFVNTKHLYILTIDNDCDTGCVRQFPNYRKANM